MNKNTRTQSINHKRNVFVIALLFILAFVGWNLFGAYQCSSRGGEFRLVGIEGRCFIDLSNR